MNTLWKIRHAVSQSAVLSCWVVVILTLVFFSAKLIYIWENNDWVSDTISLHISSHGTISQKSELALSWATRKMPDGKGDVVIVNKKLKEFESFNLPVTIVLPPRTNPSLPGAAILLGGISTSGVIYRTYLTPAVGRFHISSPRFISIGEDSVLLPREINVLYLAFCLVILFVLDFFLAVFVAAFLLEGPLPEASVSS